jgi:hypothetical protein
MVFHLCQDNPISSLKTWSQPRLSDEIDGLGCASGENYPSAILHTNEASNRLTRFFISVRRIL